MPVQPVPYLTLDHEIEMQIRADRARHWVNPLAFEDACIIRRDDNPHDRATISRPAFARDIEKIINIPAYNRYSDKTQVFSFVENDDICRRGLHVQLVSRIARGIGDLLGLNTQLIEAIALGHDLGHTPFGHAGERYLSKLLEEHTGRYFHHNVQSVRVMDRLYRRNISLQTLDGAICHNGEFACQVLELGTTKTFDDLDAMVQLCTTEAHAGKTIRPSTLEGCVVRVSDMIAYLGKDRDDARDIGVIDSLDMFDSKFIGRSNSQIINNMTCDIVNNSYGQDRISMSAEAFEDLVVAKRQNNEIIYMKEGMIDEYDNIVEDMFGQMYEKLLEDIVAGNEDSPAFKHHVDWLCTKSQSITPEEYLSEDANDIVVDYISSMTDSYFMALYRHLFPESKLHIISRDYCADLK